jgi:hypothetical protein
VLEHQKVGSFLVGSGNSVSHVRVPSPSEGAGKSVCRKNSCDDGPKAIITRDLYAQIFTRSRLPVSSLLRTSGHEPSSGHGPPSALETNDPGAAIILAAAQSTLPQDPGEAKRSLCRLTLDIHGSK